jgi:hypothetical protein
MVIHGPEEAAVLQMRVEQQIPHVQHCARRDPTRL